MSYFYIEQGCGTPGGEVCHLDPPRSPLHASKARLQIRYLAGGLDNFPCLISGVSAADALKSLGALPVFSIVK